MSVFMLSVLSLLPSASSSASFLLDLPLRTPSSRHADRPRVLAAERSGDAYADDTVLRLPLLEAEYATTDDGDRRAQLEDEIVNAKTAAEFGVRRAQVDFYSAFSGQDLDAMRKVWSDGDGVRCVHPGMQGICGREDIMKSWERVFAGEPFEIEPERVSIDICGRTAVCSCLEGTPGGGKLEALNIYRREGGTWKMTLRMASPIFAE